MNEQKINHKLVQALRRAVGEGKLVLAKGDYPRVSAVTTDSRNVPHSSLFVAVTGDRFDGNDYALAAVQAGAIAVIISSTRAEELISQLKNQNVTVFTATDTIYALGEIAKYYRNLFAAEIVGITGSAGKTTTRNTIYSILSEIGKTLSPEKNFNNQIGVPLTLFNLTDDHKYAVIEMGMSQPGEIARLTEIAQPDIGVVTNILPVHLEGLKTIENIAREKTSLYYNMKDTSIAVLNADDELAVKCAQAIKQKKITFGEKQECDVKLLSHKLDAKTLKELIKLNLNGKEIPAGLAIIGHHNAYNACAAVATAVALGIPEKAIIAGLEKVKPYVHRLELKRSGKITIIDDCYNSNPFAVKASLKVLEKLASTGKRAAVLGEMRELGADSVKLHKDVGYSAAASKISALYAFGTAEAQELAKAAREKDNQIKVSVGNNPHEAAQFIKANLANGGAVLVKGSRAMQLERVVEELEKR